MAGRRPLPTQLKVLRGTLQPCRTNPDEPKPDVEAPVPPPWLDAGAKAEWDLITPELEQLGLLARIDRGALASYCQSLSRWAAAEELIARDGLVIATPFGLQTNPAVKLAREAMEQVRKFAVEFGLTPSSRSKVRAQPKKKDDRAEKAKRFFGS